MEDPEFSIVDFETIQTFILVGLEHPLAARNTLDEEDLLHEKIYLPAPLGGYSYEHGNFVGFWVDKNNIIEVDNISTALVNVRFGNGVTIANDHMSVISQTDRYKAFPALDNSRNPRMSIITRKNITNPAVPFFIDISTFFQYFRSIFWNTAQKSRLLKKQNGRLISARPAADLFLKPTLLSRM